MNVNAISFQSHSHRVGDAESLRRHNPTHPAAHLAEDPITKEFSGIDLNNNAIYVLERGIESSFHPLPFIEKYVNDKIIQNALDNNPNIGFILKYNGLEPKIYDMNIDASLKNHMFTTYEISKKIANEVDLEDESKIKLYQAALLHDIGKALIPEEIIQKPGKLTARERDVVDLHPKLGYEILRTANADPDVSLAVLLHHTPAYQKSDNTIAHILSVADVYSALIQERPYKAAMTPNEALEIVQNIEGWKLDENIINVLANAINKS